MHRALACRAESDHNVWIRFDDGLEGRVCLANLLCLGAFKMLRDPREFRAVFVDPEAGTIIWPAGVRLDPDILYQDIAARGGARRRDIGLEDQFQRFMSLVLRRGPSGHSGRRKRS